MDCSSRSSLAFGSEINWLNKNKLRATLRGGIALVVDASHRTGSHSPFCFRSRPPPPAPCAETDVAFLGEEGCYYRSKRCSQLAVDRGGSPPPSALRPTPIQQSAHRTKNNSPTFFAEAAQRFLPSLPFLLLLLQTNRPAPSSPPSDGIDAQLDYLFSISSSGPSYIFYALDGVWRHKAQSRDASWRGGSAGSGAGSVLC